ncbi:hypothetical protein GCM10011578_098750 [Streptomyces fuscichromogenes]|uniref:Uncharacterized protein n=1 Tax=Streptomyces fuscichromogenes TaxID=1324013 RepID=A0A917XPC5_9ACTN|nr:hypothetical protein GCM10011578_098750 [Streptomyces fuscichromogenes]
MGHGGHGDGPEAQEWGVDGDPAVVPLEVVQEPPGLGQEGRRGGPPGTVRRVPDAPLDILTDAVAPFDRDGGFA